MAGTQVVIDLARGLGLIVPFLPVLLWRLIDEEKILNAQLRGYTEYTQRVRYRLIPFVW